MRKTRMSVICLWVAAVVLQASPSSTTTMRGLTLRDLVFESDVIVVGTALGQTTRMGGQGRIVRLVDFRADRYLAGDGPTRLSVQLLGGRIGRHAQKVFGEIELPQGERSVLFLERKIVNGEERFVVVGLSQGKFGITTDPDSGARFVVRDAGATGIVESSVQDEMGLSRESFSFFMDFEEFVAAIEEVAGALRR